VSAKVTQKFIFIQLRANLHLSPLFSGWNGYRKCHQFSNIQLLSGGPLSLKKARISYRWWVLFPVAIPELNNWGTTAGREKSRGPT